MRSCHASDLLRVARIGLSPPQLREVFTSLLNEGNALQQRYAGQIAEKSRQINVQDLMPLVRGS